MLYDRSTGNRDESVQRALTEAQDKTLAATLIALADGIWLEFSIAPEEMSRARAVVEALLQAAGRIRKCTAFPRPDGPRRWWNRSGIQDTGQSLPRKVGIACYGRGPAPAKCCRHTAGEGAGL